MLEKVIENWTSRLDYIRASRGSDMPEIIFKMKWFARFKSSDTILAEKPGRGRPSSFDYQFLLSAVEEDESLTTRTLSEDFNVNQSTVVRRLKNLAKVWKTAGWVSHELSNNNRAYRVRIFTELLQRNELTPFLKNLAIGNESLLLFKNVKKEALPESSVWGTVIEVEGDYAPK
ncbi:histone-lysine N-methyltransferase SETMAR [Trichonephila clavipes]|nr:histone-lysine N-methyltransferase SETMAR [Trichonephila clavipes]